MLQLISPFPQDHYAEAWKWLREFPDANFDDYGPQNQDAFAAEMARRAKTERTWGVLLDGELCGVIGALALSPDRRLWTWHGICFAQRVHHSGVPQEAVQRIIAELFESGCAKLCAGFFSHNFRIERFLASLGFLNEGVLRRHTLQHGQPVAMRLMAKFST